MGIKVPHIPIFARAIIPPEAALVSSMHCIECGQTHKSGDRIYGDTVSPSANPATLCRVCGDAYRDEYSFASDEENWETTPAE